MDRQRRSRIASPTRRSPGCSRSWSRFPDGRTPACCWCRRIRPASAYAPTKSPGSTVSCGDVTFKDCRVPADNLARRRRGGAADRRGCARSRHSARCRSLNLGIGRAAYEAALDYAHLRVQGGRPMIEHQAIAHQTRRDRDQAGGRARRDLAGGLGVRSSGGLCRPQPVRPAVADRRAGVHLRAAAESHQGCGEMFGAMGVMRDMPLQKYVHDARVCLHSGDGNSRRQAADRGGPRRLSASPATARWRWRANNRAAKI